MDADPEPYCSKYNEELESELCPFCLNDLIYKGADWSPKKCLYCGAVKLFDEWLIEG